ncbi:MAG TPA: guanylate kinase [Phycisphaerae bacterium]|nr:guanylate kinase [Phycisphaerae bacterium]
MNQKGLLLFLSGPGGVGKSTICNRLAEELPAVFIPSATTRPQKPQDKLAKPYIFVNEEKFRSMIEKGEFLEYATVFGHLYGTMKQPVLEALALGKTALLEIDVQGAISIAGQFPEAIGFFILPPSRDALTKRLVNRKRDEPEVIQKRLQGAEKEIQAAKESGVYRITIKNNVLEDTIRQLVTLVRSLKTDAKQ